ncbi:hypothetical protein L6164_030803 [Bauhinia variegata]|uniref:Uncharacterized protein n=1 Tax=Bauhinia variegata TaxID=167791 RepID=A0ACB9LDL8_BAUVA|nr:hypothetical protein L6164_030803 [Bauhinia variegata]
MGLDRKRSYHDHSPDSTSDPNKKRPVFPSYLEVPTLAPKIKSVCEIIANTPSLAVEKALEETGIRVNPEDVEEVLKLSYGFPGPAVKFFRWSGYQLNDKHSPYSWNLVVDLLGKNRFFDAMWDAIKSMKKEGLLSLATFASVFSSYVAADRVKEAIYTFDVMGQYGLPRDTIALNSLLSAICRDGKTVDAYEFLRVAKDTIRPDMDTYAILLEGWENERNVASACQTFSEMVIEVGWEPSNVSAYDSFLCTLIRGPDGIHEAIKYFEAMRDWRCFPGMKFFKVALDVCVECHNVRIAEMLWEVMIARMGLQPDTSLYNCMIALYCYHNDTDTAMRKLDDMVYKGIFPDSKSYNLLFRFLIKGRKLREATVILSEMIKNECIPDQSSCNAAVRVYLENGDPYMATKVWKCMVENYRNDLEETGNILIVGLRDQNRVPEAVKYAEDMIDRTIKLTSSTLSKLRQSLIKGGKEFAYNELLRKWKIH